MFFLLYVLLMLKMDPLILSSGQLVVLLFSVVYWHRLLMSPPLAEVRNCKKETTKLITVVDLSHTQYPYHSHITTNLSAISVGIKYIVSVYLTPTLNIINCFISGRSCELV